MVRVGQSSRKKHHIATFFCLALSFAFSPQAHAGGPAFVAGSTNFDPTKMGQPLIWLNGNILYFTDQGDLSPLLPQTSANSFVADAFARWTSVNTAAVAALRAGSLAEDVNAANVISTSSGVTLPTDIQASSTDKPVAIVYDLDGQVIDRLLGAGASDPSLCSSNSVIGGIDRFSIDAHIAHGLLVLNGRCAQTSADLPPLKYHLVRAIGRLVGLGWSQANDNVQTGTPFPTNADLLGFPLMHPLEPFCSSLITDCIPSADQLRMDDRAALSRLYPVTPQNIAAFPGKQIFAKNTISIHGVVYFPNVRGEPGQPMQGVNVVARLIDPASGQPSRQVVATSVSGFLFRGNSGNPVTGFGGNQPFTNFGSDDTTLEGYYDLSGLELPPGQMTADYQLSIEPINTFYKDESNVGPYAAGQISISGFIAPVIIANLSAGSDVAQDLIMTGGPVSKDSSPPNPLFLKAIPSSGDWWGALSTYRMTEWLSFAAQANRTFDLQITAVDYSRSANSSKLLPVIGMWQASDALTVAPRASATAFNALALGTTDLQAATPGTAIIKLAVADLRGDGRPDFIYHAHFLYADSITPDRVTGAGVPLLVHGIGFHSGMTAFIGGVSSPVISSDQTSMVISAPALSQGSQDLDLVIRDASTGIQTAIKSAVNYGAVGGDQLVLLVGTNSNTPVGASATNPMVVRAVAADGITPISGINISFAVSPSQSSLAPCGAVTCVLTTDANGEASVRATVNAAGTNTITASISNGFSKSTFINAVSTTTLAAQNPIIRLISGSSTVVPLSALLLSSGSPLAGQTISFTMTSGAGALSATSAGTASNGVATVNLTVSNLLANTSVNACPATGVCSAFSILPITAANIGLKKIGGDSQIITDGHTIQPISLRVVDASSPTNGLANVPVTVIGSVVSVVVSGECAVAQGCPPSDPHFVSNFATTLISDSNGLVSFTPTVQSSWGTVEINVLATAGSNASQTFKLHVIPAP